MTATTERPASADPHVCKRCTDRGPTCCRMKPGEEEACFPLSAIERDRILEVAGDKGAFAQQANTELFVEYLRRLFPRDILNLNQLFPPHGTHLRLATREDGSCALLGPDGCTLPREARPHYCLIFPFWLMGDRLTTFAPPGCLAVEEGGSIRRMLELFGMSEAEVRTLHGRIRLAWGLPPKEGMRLPEPGSRRKV